MVHGAGTVRHHALWDVVAPTIELAERGLPDVPLSRPQPVQTAPETYRRYPGNAAVFLPNGRPPPRCEMFYQKIWRRRCATSWPWRSRTALKGREAGAAGGQG